MNEKTWGFDLQLFGEGGEGSGEGGAAGGDGKGDGNGKNGGRADNASAGGESGGKNYTPEELEATLSTKLTEKLAIEKAKWEKDYQIKLEAAKKEQERLSKLSDDDRKKVEFEAAQIKLAEKEKELKIKELKLEVVEDLAKRNIPVSFLDYLVDEDSEKTLGRITNFEKEYKKAIDVSVNERLKGKTPKSGDKSGSRNSAQQAKSGFLGDLKSVQARKY